MSVKKCFFPYYKLQKGENLKIICKKFNIDAVELLLKNNLAPHELKEGTIIKL